MSYFANNQIYGTFKDFFEVLSFLATIVAVISIFIAVRQLRIMKEEKSASEKRIIIGYSIEVLEKFSNTIIPIISKYETEIEEEYKKLSKNKPDRDHLCANNFKIVNKEKLDKLQLSEIVLCGNYECGHIMNLLEHICVYIANDLVDERIVYTPIHHVFLNFVEDNAIFLSYIRKEEVPYKNLIETYNKWKNKQ